jgi:glycosyltransferase involved in cell wall biosynthesis
VTVPIVVVCTSDQFVHFLDGPLREQARLGYAVHLATRLGPRSRLLRETGLVTVHDLPLSRRMAPAEDAVALARTVALFRQLRPQLVHAHNPKAGLIAMAAARLAGVPRRVYTVHGLPHVTAHGARRKLLMAAEALACRLAQRVLPVSASVEEELLAKRVASPKAISRVGAGSADGVDTEHFRPNPESGRTLRRRLEVPEGAPVLLFVGRLHREKGLDDLMRAFEIVTRALPEVRLLIVGERDPTDLPEARTLRARPHVHFLGELSDPRPAYAAADMLVLPSFREGLPTVVLEAGAMELPTVAYDGLGVRDALGAVDMGQLVPVRDVDALAGACVALLKQPERRRAMGRAGRARMVDEFDPGRIRAGVLEVYAKLGLERPAGRTV